MPPTMQRPCLIEDDHDKDDRNDDDGDGDDEEQKDKKDDKDSKRVGDEETRLLRARKEEEDRTGAAEGTRRT